MKHQVYLDHAATTPMSAQAQAAYLAACDPRYANPSSRHDAGRAAAGLLREARESVMLALGAREGELIFTSGGTEANNLALLGRVFAKERFAGGRILLGEGEHPSVAATAAYLEKRGFTLSLIPTRGGVADLAGLERATGPDVVLVSLMSVNNETGAHYDLPAVAELVRRHCPGAALHTDATQAFCKVSFTPASLGVDLVTVSGHKMGGPMGVGALWVSPALWQSKGLSPLLAGGGQEGGMRSGTENVPAISAFGAACRVGRATFATDTAHLASLRQGLVERLQSDPLLQGVTPNLPPRAAPHILSLTLPGVRAETMQNYLSRMGVYVSSGSACSSNAKRARASAALLAYGLDQETAACTLRVSFGTANTAGDLDAFCRALADGLALLTSA
ncbi:MAG: cysteine desulfurase family protein [Eubacteriales bacterium]